MKIRFFCLIFQLFLFKVNGLNLGLQNQLQKNFLNRVKKTIKRRKDENNLRAKLKDQMWKDYHKQVKKEIKKLRDEEEADEGDFWKNYAKFKRKHSHVNDLVPRKHELTDVELRKLGNDLENSILQDVHKFVSAVGAY